MATAATTTKTKTKVVTAPPEVITPPATGMPAQIEGPAKFDPQIAALCEIPILVDPRLASEAIAVKCVGPKGKTWIELHQRDLDVYGQYYVMRHNIGRMTLVDVQFASKVVKETHGCGGQSTTHRIGYVLGKQLLNGYVHPQAHTFIPKYDRETGRFMVDGLEVIGAKAIILGDDCIALIVDPIFKERA
jgi:hypothetical protein